MHTWQQSELDVLSSGEKAKRVKVGDHIEETNGTFKRVTAVSKDGKTIEAVDIKHS